jgi:hypothetical protein
MRLVLLLLDKDGAEKFRAPEGCICATSEIVDDVDVLNRPHMLVLGQAMALAVYRNRHAAAEGPEPDA